MPKVVFDDLCSGTCKVFEAPVEVIRAGDGVEVEAALARMQDRIDAGFHLAGWFSYELGYLLEDRLASCLPKSRSVPLLWFGVFDGPPRNLSGTDLELEWQYYRAYAGPLEFEWDEATYAGKFAEVAGHIRDGDIYQANLSMRGRFTVVGDPRGLYRAMRRHGGATFGAYLDDGVRSILSFSPELFFEATADGTLTCKPMKGTAPRVPNDAAADAAARATLQANPKDRAENLMIVDLVRNDLGRVAATGSVEVGGLFEVESLPTVHQMVSTVTAKVDQDVPVRRMLEALFPCGSVTGAPKIRAMEILRELETSPRGVYCGAIGWFAPDRSACFNVAIRTLTVADGHGELGIGSGLVADSRAADEFAECLLKARYFEAARRPVKLIETLRYEAGGYARLELHLRRLEHAARAFGIAFDRERLLATMADAGRGMPPLRVRLTLDEAGRIETESGEFAPTAAWYFRISKTTVHSDDALLRFKTDWRGMYDAERERAARESGCDEVVFCNERGELCEGSRSNLFLAIDDELLTPAASSGLLEGCLRKQLLAAGRCREAVLGRSDLARAERVWLGNSLRGLVPAIRVDAPHAPPPIRREIASAESRPAST